MNLNRILGWRPSNPDGFYVKDDDGVIEVNIDFIRDHPDWYAYAGSCRVNGQLRHTFLYLPPESRA